MTHGLWGDIYKYDYWSIIITELEQLLRSSSGQFTLLLPSSQMLSSFLHHWLETWLCLILANEGTNEGRGHHDTTCTVVENHKNVSFCNIASGASYVKSAVSPTNVSCLFTFTVRMSAVCLHFWYQCQLFVYIFDMYQCQLYVYISDMYLPMSAVCLHLWYHCQLFVYISDTNVSCLFTFIVLMSAVCLHLRYSCQKLK